MLERNELLEVIDVGISLTTEKDKNRLLNMILEKTMKLSHCDAGTLYLYHDDALEFRIMKTLSQAVNRGADGDSVELPPVPMVESHVCAYAAIRRELVNIEDVYHSERFDFSGPKKYDAITGYHTQSMLVIPMEDTGGELVGVIQLMNAKDETGQIVAFSDDDAFVLRALASQAAVAVTNMLYVYEMKEQMYSFVSAFATAVDARTPYNGMHTRKVTLYAVILADWINAKHARGECELYIDENRREQLVLAAALHDIGKMVVPLSVMNKATRLDEHFADVERRMELFLAYYEIDMLKGRIAPAQCDGMSSYIEESLIFLREVNGAGFLTDEQIARVEEIAAHRYKKQDGTEIPFLTDYEKEALCIRKGTLTEAERRQMENHVVMTGKILEKVRFSKQYENVPRLAASHHELLNGSGYPEHKKGDELSLETRILTVTDIFDALTSSDRPYKEPMPREKAFAVLRTMADEGKVEHRLVEWLAEALANVSIEDIERRQMF